MRGPIAWSPLIYLKGTCLPVVSEFKFLRFIISRNLHYQKHINYILHMLLRLLKTNKVLTFSNMLLIYKSVIISSVTYGISFWYRTALTSTYSKKFISLQRKCLIAITGCLRTSPSDSVDIVAEVLPIMLYLQGNVFNCVKPIFFKPDLIERYIRPIHNAKKIRCPNSLGSEKMGVEVVYVKPFRLL